MRVITYDLLASTGATKRAQGNTKGRQADTKHVKGCQGAPRVTNGNPKGAAAGRAGWQGHAKGPPRDAKGTPRGVQGTPRGKNARHREASDGERANAPVRLDVFLFFGTGPRNCILNVMFWRALSRRQMEDDQMRPFPP